MTEMILPPAGFIPPILPQSIALGIVLVSYVPVLIMVVQLMREEHSALPLFILIGGFLAMICEPLTNVTHHVYHGEANMTMFTLLGRPIPYWAALTWPLFTAGGALFLYRMMKAPGGMSHKIYWGVVLAVIVTNIVMEIPMLQFHAYEYYGPQALKVFEMPLWWLTVNVSGPILCGLILSNFRAWFFGPKLLFCLLLPVMTAIAGIMSVSFPVGIAMNDGVTGGMLHLSGVVTALIGLTFLYCLGKLPVVSAPEASPRVKLLK